MATIPEIIEELKTRRDWKHYGEVEQKFDDILAEFEKYQAEEFSRHKTSERKMKNDIIKTIDLACEKHIENSFDDVTAPTTNEVRRAYSNCINIIEGMM